MILDLFKFSPPIPQYTNLIRGTPIEGASSKLWTERYRELGEFKIEAPLSSGLKQTLPLGSIISHTDTLDAMIVESHNIIDDVDADPTITIWGRSLGALSERRIIGINKSQFEFTGQTADYGDYTIPTAMTWHQAVTLLNQHISVSQTIDTANAFDNIEAFTDLTDTGSSESNIDGTAEARTFKRGTVLARLLELLAIDDLGLRVIRKNPFGIGSEEKTLFVIHAGVDRSDSVIFSWSTGDIESAEYLWSDKVVKNAALVTSRYIEVAVVPGISGFNRRWMQVDASDLDQHLTAAPTSTALSNQRDKMVIRGQEALKSQKEINITRSEISKNTQWRYRLDYNIGDIISIDGNYGEIEKRRVVEYTEIEDEAGESGHPTLAVLGQ